MKGRDDVALRRIDIDNWDSPVAKQFNLNSLPALYLYDGDELVSKNGPQILQRLQNAPG